MPKCWQWDGDLVQARCSTGMLIIVIPQTEQNSRNNLQSATFFKDEWPFEPKTAFILNPRVDFSLMMWLNQFSMELISSIFIGIGLAMDSFTVSLGIGTGGCANDRRAKFRLAFHFGFFQMAMTVIGWFTGSTVARYIEAFDHWIAMGLLAYVGGNMIRSGLNPDFDSYVSDPSKGRLLVFLSVATSIDAMAVGLSMAMLQAPWLVPAIIIGLVTWGLSSFGLLAGDRLGQKFGKRMEILGGLILLGIGVRILVTHLIM